MLLLSCSRLTRGFDAGPLFRDLGFELHAGDRVGLIGPNGAGKTTLLRLLAGLDQPDDGKVHLHAGARVALLRQQPEFAAGQSLFDEALTALKELLAAQEDMVRTAEALARSTDHAEHKALAARYDRLNELLRHQDAYHVDHRVEQMLDGLGFRGDDYPRPVATFSGGQLSRLMLAKLLLAAPDVMLLDEPSNHLDIEATRWLEEYLAAQPQAMLIVSHDRYFLDRVVTKIFELHAGRLTEYPGNYQAYTRLRRERYEHQVKEWEAQEEYVAKQEDYIRRVHYGQSHRQAQSRRKTLERLERVERPVSLEGPHMQFGTVPRAGDVVIQAEELGKAYDLPLFAGLSFTLERGRRLGILGPNGSGKTTLLRVLMGDEPPDSGVAQRGHGIEFGYYDQHLKTLPAELPVIRAIWPAGDPRATEQAMRDLLGRFGLKGEQVYQQVGALSGGERSRAALARLVVLGVNVLVLDEPTNHLDLWACDALELALLEYEGTVIVVSHDRYFLNRVVDQMIVLGDGQAQVIHGNYDVYERMRALQPKPKDLKREGSEPETGRPAAAPAGSGLPSRQKRKRRFPYRKVEEIEADIGAGEADLKRLEQLMASPDLYRDGEQVKQAMRAFEEAKAHLHYLYEHWEEASELN